jgi:hypothetical protein
MSTGQSLDEQKAELLTKLLKTYPVLYEKYKTFNSFLATEVPVITEVSIKEDNTNFSGNMRNLTLEETIVYCAALRKNIQNTKINFFYLI